MFTYLDPNTLKDYSKNAKKHSPDQIKKLARAFKEEGFHGSILVDEDLIIIAGHGRKYAAIEAGLETIPVQILEGLSEEQKRSKRLGDNRLAESDWLDEYLKEKLTFLAEQEYDVSLSGFDLDFIGEVENDAWNDMPEFKQENKMSYRDIKIHFKNEADIQEFSKLVGQKITDKTKYLWFPEVLNEPVKHLKYDE